MSARGMPCQKVVSCFAGSIAKVVFADEACAAVAHRVDVEVPHGEKVLVVLRTAH